MSQNQPIGTNFARFVANLFTQSSAQHFTSWPCAIPWKRLGAHFTASAPGRRDPGYATENESTDNSQIQGKRCVLTCSQFDRPYPVFRCNYPSLSPTVHTLHREYNSIPATTIARIISQKSFLSPKKKSDILSVIRASIPDISNFWQCIAILCRYQIILTLFIKTKGPNNPLPTHLKCNLSSDVYNLCYDLPAYHA